MMRTARIPLITVAVFLITVPTVYCLAEWWLPGLFIWNFVRTMSKEKDERMVRLLYKTDHQAVLQACRELAKRVATGNLKPGTYFLGSHPDHEVAGFPQAILDLGPSGVSIDDNGRVVLEMMGGLDHFGVEAYPEDYSGSIPGSGIGNKELIPGLWYYDDGYHERPKDYEKWIERLRPKSRR